jgi:hypothetical protein
MYNKSHELILLYIQALMVIFVLISSTILHYFNRPYNRRGDGSDILNTVEMFTLITSTLILVGGLAMTR